MSPQSTEQFERHLQPREHKSTFPQLALRRRSADHPMVMVAVIVAAAVASMALVQSEAPAFASIGFSSPEMDGSRAKGDRLSLTEIDMACHGQAWGAETETCLIAIARRSGKGDDFAVRLVALSGPTAIGPTIF